MPRVSVIIPAFNAGNTIGKCLESLKVQTFKDFEILVVDDHSRDQTAEIAARYARVICSEAHLCEGAARNFGAKASGGNILAFTDADVIVPPDWLEKIVRNLDSQNVKCVGGGYCGSAGDSFMELFALHELGYRRKDLNLFVNTLVSNNFACTREVFFECGGFPEKFKCEDLRLSYEIGKKYPILWDSQNGVVHHFRRSLIAYLRQQFYFSKDTVWSYYCYPAMAFKKTHQGRLLYLETLLMGCALMCLFFSPVLSMGFLVLILAANFRFLKCLRQKNLPPVKSAVVILLRDFVCVVGIVCGMVFCLKSFLSRSFRQNTGGRP